MKKMLIRILSALCKAAIILIAILGVLPGQAALAADITEAEEAVLLQDALDEAKPQLREAAKIPVRYTAKEAEKLRNSKIPHRVHPSEDVIVVDFDVNDFGADPTGVKDSTDAIQSALDAAYAIGGGTVWLGAGTYRVTETIHVHPFCGVRGDWRDPDTKGDAYGTVIQVETPSDTEWAPSHPNPYRGKGSELGLKTYGPAVFVINGGSHVSGLTFYWPNQNADKPVPYGYAIVMPGAHGVPDVPENYTTGNAFQCYMVSTVENITLLNAYRGIGMGATDGTGYFENYLRPHDMVAIRNIKGTPLYRGFKFANNDDHSSTENVIFNSSYWANAPQKYNPQPAEKIKAFTREYGHAFSYGDCEWEMSYNLKCSDYKYGIRIFSGWRTQFIGQFANVEINNAQTAVHIENGFTGEGRGMNFVHCRLDGDVSMQDLTGRIPILITDCELTGAVLGVGGNLDTTTTPAVVMNKDIDLTVSDQITLAYKIDDVKHIGSLPDSNMPNGLRIMFSTSDANTAFTKWKGNFSSVIPNNVEQVVSGQWCFLTFSIKDMVDHTGNISKDPAQMKNIKSVFVQTVMNSMNGAEQSIDMLASTKLQDLYMIPGGLALTDGKLSADTAADFSLKNLTSDSVLALKMRVNDPKLLTGKLSLALSSEKIANWSGSALIWDNIPVGQLKANEWTTVYLPVSLMKEQGMKLEGAAIKSAAIKASTAANGLKLEVQSVQELKCLQMIWDIEPGSYTNLYGDIFTDNTADFVFGTGSIKSVLPPVDGPVNQSVPQYTPEFEKSGIQRPKVSREVLYDVSKAPYNAPYVVPQTVAPAKDATSAIQEALTDAGNAGGGVVYLPAGWYRIDGHLDIPGNVELRGCLNASREVQDLSYGTVLMAYEGKGALLASAVEKYHSKVHPALMNLKGNNSGIVGLRVFYPENNPENGIRPYPFVIRGSSENMYVVNLGLGGSYNLIDFSKGCEGHYIRRILGTNYNTGIVIGPCKVGTIQACHTNIHGTYRSGYHDLFNYPEEGMNYSQYAMADVGDSVIRKQEVMMIFDGAANEFLHSNGAYMMSTFCKVKSGNIHMYNNIVDNEANAGYFCYAPGKNALVQLTNVFQYNGTIAHGNVTVVNQKLIPWKPAWGNRF